MSRQQAIYAAIGCEVAGLIILVFINKVLPFPYNLLITGVGFLLLFVGPFMLVFKRD